MGLFRVYGALYSVWCPLQCMVPFAVYGALNTVRLSAMFRRYQQLIAPLPDWTASKSRSKVNNRFREADPVLCTYVTSGRHLFRRGARCWRAKLPLSQHDLPSDATPGEHAASSAPRTHAPCCTVQLTSLTKHAFNSLSWRWRIWRFVCRWVNHKIIRRLWKPTFRYLLHSTSTLALNLS
jgi:hypothetical protein